MASSCSTGGRGRGRGRASTRKIDEIPSPSIITPSPSIVTPSSEHDSAVSDDNSSSKSQPVLPIGGSRGRGFRRKQKQMVPNDPHHLDSTLTVDTLQPSIQSIKSAESGTIGDPIEVMGVTELIQCPNSSNQMEEFKFTIKLVGDPIDFSLLRSPNAFLTAHRDLTQVKQALSIALHEHCSSHAEFVYNRLFYAQPTVEYQYGYWDLGMGKALWRGFYSCLKFANGTYKLLTNLDVNYSIFMKKQPFLDFLCEIMLDSPCGKRKYGRQRNIRKADLNDVVQFLDSNSNRTYYEGEVEFLLKHCKNLHIRWNDTTTSRIFTIQNLGKPASDQTFEWKQRGNRTVTVQQYHKERYGQNLKYPSLPVLQLGKNFFKDIENIDVEPVRIKRITDEQRIRLSKYSILKPSERCQAIEQVRHNTNQQCFENDLFVRFWNLRIHPKMTIEPARILPKPEVVYGNKDQAKAEGVQLSDKRQTRFHTPTQFPTVWAMINLSSNMDEQSCEMFYIKLRDLGHLRGMKIPPPEIYEELGSRRQSTDAAVNLLKQMSQSNHDCEFILVILPDSTWKDESPYGDLKAMLKPDEIQMLTYALCFTYARWNRSISIPAPLKYATLLAQRAGLYVKSNDKLDKKSTSSSTRQATPENTEEHRNIVSTRIPLSSKLVADCPFFI
ncbi:unnamed protein product [Rotaria sordida]|uniref:Uncharacterized protein n=1 Tax=Rotaria sordida TaxID=392033 RepID=A0A814UU55_9BILA|nr:unnamed protein product [Rotaria sordida]